MLCVVTDRRGADVLDQARRAAAAGIDLFQIRERDLEARALASLVSAVLDAVRRSRMRVVVNDRVDVALACGADGVHLRADSIGVADVRRLAPRPFIVGRSVHSPDEAAASAGADYLIAGTVFPTTSKPDATSWLGVAGLRSVVQASPSPVLAIGGISRERFADVAAAGAAGVAAIALFARGPLHDIVESARRLFDSPEAHP